MKLINFLKRLWIKQIVIVKPKYILIIKLWFFGKMEIRKKPVMNMRGQKFNYVIVDEK